MYLHFLPSIHCFRLIVPLSDQFIAELSEVASTSRPQELIYNNAITLLCFVHSCFCLFWFDFGIGHFSVQLGVPWLRRFVVKTCPGGPGVVRDCLIEDSIIKCVEVHMF